jgi:Tol biopolymer transport system component
MRAASTLLVLVLAWVSSEVAIRRVCEGPQSTILGGPSPDGRFLSCLDPETGDLALLDLASGQRRRLTHKASQSSEFAYFSVVSPDSRRVAYAWFNQEKFYELRVVAVDGSDPRILYRNEEAGFVQPSAWSPDGKEILTLFFRKDSISQIALVSTTDGSVRVLKSLNWVYPKKMDFSPDGRFIVYDTFGRNAARERDIFVLSTDGSREVALVEHPADDLFPLWSPDGRRILFASDRAGTMDLWMISVVDGKPQGSAALVRRNLGRILPMGMTRSGGLFYGLRTGTSDVYVASFDPGEGRMLGRAVLASHRSPGGNSAPEWSPDGKLLAYFSRRGTENFGQEARVISIRALETGEERDLAPKLAHLESIRWSQDGRYFLAAGSDRRSRGGLYRVDVRSGDVAPIVQDELATFRGLEGIWSADGEGVLYVVRSEIRLRSLQTAQEKSLYVAAASTRIRHLALAPEGRWLAFVSSEGTQAEVLRVMPAGGGAARELFRLAGGGSTGAEWTPDGRHLILTASGEGNPEIWRVSLEGGQALKMAIPPDWQGSLRVHPDGHRIAFAGGQSRSEVWVMEKFLP